MARVIGLKACCCNVFICEHFSSPLFYAPNMCQNHRCVCFLLPNYWAYKLSTWTLQWGVSITYIASKTTCVMQIICGIYHSYRCHQEEIIKAMRSISQSCKPLNEVVNPSTMQVWRLGSWHQSSTRHSERAAKDTAHLHIDPTDWPSFCYCRSRTRAMSTSLELGTTATYVGTRHDDTEGRLPYTEISEDYRSQHSKSH
jgi:hypothetical protein